MIDDQKSDHTDEPFDGEIESAGEHDHPLTMEEVREELPMTYPAMADPVIPPELPPFPPEAKPIELPLSRGSRLDQREDKTAIIVLGFLIIFIVGAIAWGVATMGPQLQEMLDKPKPTEVSTAMYVTDLMADPELAAQVCSDYGCPELICPEPMPLECPVLVCPGCDPCPTTPGMEITDNREEINNYLAQADKALIRMEAAITLMDEVSLVLRSFGDTQAGQAQAFNDPQWKILLESMDQKVESIRSVLDNIWPPAPHNSCNPILDAHARLLLAFANLDECRDDMIAGYFLKDPSNIAFLYQNHIEDARVNISHARTQLAHVR